MTTGNTTLLGLALPVEGELDGTWGTVYNDSATSLVDTAVAGTTTLTTDADVTLTDTPLVANQARQAIIVWNPSGSPAATTRTILAPARSKTYSIVNRSTNTAQSIAFKGVGPTTGVTVTNGEKCLVVWNGDDFVKIASTTGVTSFSFGTLGFSPSTSTSGAVVAAGVLNVANGGTGASDASGARSSLGLVIGTDVLAPTGSAAALTDFPTFNQNTTGTAAALSTTLALSGGGTGATSASDARDNLGLTIGVNVLAPTGSAAALTSFPTLNQNTTGTAAGLSATLDVASGGTGSTTASGARTNLGVVIGTDVLAPNGSAAALTGLPLTTGVTGTLPVANGGTGATSLAANNVVLGNGTSALQVVAPGTSGNVLTSDGTTWASSTPAASGVSTGQSICFALLFA